MEKRVLLAIFLSFLVLYVYQALFAPPTPTPAPAGPAATVPGTAPATEKPTPSPVVPTEPAPSSAAPLLGEASERDVRIETPNFVAVFTNRGARLKSWRLKKYQDNAKVPVELVPSALGDAHPLPFSLRVPQDAGVSSTLNGAVYSVSGAPGADGSISS